MPTALTVERMIKYLEQFPGHLKLAVYYQLNDWPGDCWGLLEENATVCKPISKTTTGSADPDANTDMLIFEV